jgi:hypothetical protein
VNCDETYPLRPDVVSFCLRLSSDGGSSYLESGTAHDAQQIIEFEEGVSEAAEEATKEDEKTAKEGSKKLEEASQCKPLTAT